MPIVEMPDGSEIEFPDNMSPSDISAAIQKMGAPQAARVPEQPRNLFQRIDDWAGESLRKQAAQGSLTDQIAQGASFGFADEISAGLRAPIKAGISYARGGDFSLSDAYSQGLQEEQARLRNYAQENPGKAIAGQVLGGVMLPLKSANVFKGAGLGSRVGNAAITGTGTGALYGAGAAEGDLGDRAKGAAIGGTLGGVVGGAVPLISAAVSGGWNALKNAVGAQNPNNAALNRIMRAMQDDGLTPEQAAQYLDDMRAMGKPGSLADAGENLQSLGAYVAKQPGAGRTAAQDFVRTRQAGQADRLGDDVKQYLTKGPEYYANVEKLIQSRAKKSAPLYKKAYAKDFVWNDALEELTKRPSMKAAMARAYRIAAEEGRDPKGLGLDFNEAGDVVYTKAPSMQTLDYVKRGLDDVLEQFRDKVTGKLRLDESGRAINATKNDFLNQIDMINPAYRQARQAYSGPSQSLEALRMGRNVFKAKDAEQVATEIGRLTKGDRDFYRIGVARAIRDLMDTKTEGANKAAAILGTPKKQKALAELFGGEAKFKAFLKAAEAEGRMHQTYTRVTGGSPTQPLMAEGDALTGLDTVSNLAQGRPMAAIGSALRATSERLKGVNQQAGEQIGNVLFQSDPGALAAYIQSLRATNAATATASRRSQALQGLLAQESGVLGGLLGAHAVQP